MKKLFAFSIGLVFVLGTTMASAGEPMRPIANAITVGPSRCLDVTTLAHHVGMWLHASELDARLAVVVSDTPEGVRFVVRRDGAILGERNLEVAKVSCEEIHAAVGLGIASAIDATILGDLGVTPRAPELPVLAPTPPPGPEPVIPTQSLGSGARFISHFPPPPPVSERTLTFTLPGMILVGVLPQTTIGVAPSAELSVTRRFDLRASALVTGKTTIAIGSGTADVDLLAGRLDACATLVLRADVARLRGCAGILAGAVNAAGSGFLDPRTTVSPWIAPAIRLDARWSLNPVFGLVFGFDGFFPGLKPELQVTDPNGSVVHAQTFPLAGLGVSVGPSLTF